MKQLKAFLLAEADTIIAKDADDAIAVDTTDLSIDEVVEKLLALVKERCIESN